MSAQQSVEILAGEEAIFSCRVDSNPAPAISWLRGPLEQQTIVKHASAVYSLNFSIFATLEEEFGEYWCVARVEGFEPARHRVLLKKKGPPKIIKTASVVYAGY